MSGANKFSGEGQSRNNHFIPYYRPIVKEKVVPSENVTLNENIEKGTNLLDDMDNTKSTETNTFQCVMIQ